MKFTGTVAYSEQKVRYIFNNDDGTTEQRVTRASLGGNYERDEIDLAKYNNQHVSVNGEWEHEWILDATVVQAFGKTEEQRPACLANSLVDEGSQLLATIVHQMTVRPQDNQGITIPQLFKAGINDIELEISVGVTSTLKITIKGPEK